MIKHLAEFFGYSACIFFGLWSIYCYGNNEVTMLIIVFVTFAASSFNVAFIGIFEKMKISDFQNWPIGITFLEIIIYTILLAIVDKLIFELDFIQVSNPFFDFPFTYIYPFVIIFFLCLFYKKWFVGQNIINIDNDDILDA